VISGLEKRQSSERRIALDAARQTEVHIMHGEIRYEEQLI
jgi:hypothetical protein